MNYWHAVGYVLFLAVVALLGVLLVGAIISAV